MFRNISVIGQANLDIQTNFYQVLEQRLVYDKNENLVKELKENQGEHLHEIGLNNLVNNNNDLIFEIVLLIV